jgi:hypothetical protein
MQVKVSGYHNFRKEVKKKQSKGKTPDADDPGSNVPQFFSGK